MTALAIILCVLCQFFLVVGQLFLKHGMNAISATSPRRNAYFHLTAGIACLAAWFFVWVGLLQSWELSKLFPFEGLNPALLVLGAAIFLRERIPLSAWAGIALIAVGVTLVSGS